MNDRRPEAPLLSIVVLAWDNLELTRRCVESLREHTDVPMELIIVDNGSEADAADYARRAADRAILNPANRGFAAGMNQGLEVARGSYVAFVNNDTRFPPGWASLLLASFSENPRAGIVAPAVTAAGNPVTVRDMPGTEVLVLPPFCELPSGVVYVLAADLVRSLGGWNEDYPVASSEDLDLAFTVWANDLDVVLDTRVLVEHVSRATVGSKLEDYPTLRRANLRRFLDRWSSEAPDVPRVPTCSAPTMAARLVAARAAATWIERTVAAREPAAGQAPSGGPATTTEQGSGPGAQRGPWAALVDRIRGR